jgi:iron(III) transport system substrate-binding protein
MRAADGPVGKIAAGPKAKTVRRLPNLCDGGFHRSLVRVRLGSKRAMSVENKAPRGDGICPKDRFARSGMVWQFWLLGSAPVLGFGFWLLFGLGAGGRSDASGTVVVYVAQDQVYAEPILKDFEKETGIRVRTVFDSEAVKTVGLVNRLLAEREHPQCDVYWGNEELRTRQLATRGIFRETNGWAAFGYRSRRLVMSGSTTNVSPPGSLLELTNAVYRGRIALAYPLFGTTATHLLALRQLWGEAAWIAWCRALMANKPFLVDGNSVAARFVVRGEAFVGLTDSDDIAAEIREGANLKALPMTRETLLIPNTVAVIRRAPHPEPAQRLIAHLQRRDVIQRLIEARALEGLSVDEVSAPTLKPDWDELLQDLESATGALQKTFVR